MCDFCTFPKVGCSKIYINTWLSQIISSKVFAVSLPQIWSVWQLFHANIAIFLPRGAALAKFIGGACPKAKFCCRIAKFSQLTMSWTVCSYPNSNSGNWFPPKDVTWDRITLSESKGHVWKTLQLTKFLQAAKIKKSKKRLDSDILAMYLPKGWLPAAFWFFQMPSF